MHQTYPEPVTTQFRKKSVCKLYCKYCSSNVCSRGMKALLLADNRVELYSTDMPPMSKIQLIGYDYTTRSCRCKIRNIACLGCGNEIGYHIIQPCLECLKSCNNGHFWMFLTESVSAQEQKDTNNEGVLYWSNVSSDADPEDLPSTMNRDIVCR